MTTDFQEESTSVERDNNPLSDTVRLKARDSSATDLTDENFLTKTENTDPLDQIARFTDIPTGQNDRITSFLIPLKSSPTHDAETYKSESSLS